MYKKIIAILILSVSMLPESQAQKSIKALLITSSGDSLNGFVKLPASNRSPQSFNFSIGDSKQFTIYPADKIKSVHIYNGNDLQVYESFLVRYDSSSQNITSLSNRADADWKEERFLMLLLSEGAVNLYRLADENDRVHFFAAKRGEQPTELISRSYNVEDNVATNNLFKSQLGVLLKNCGSISARETEAANYSEKSISDLVNRFNACQSDQHYTIKSQKANMVFNFLVGANYTSLSLSGTDPVVKSFNGSILPALGLGLNIIFPRNEGKSSIVFELMSKMQRNQGSASNYRNANDFITYKDEYSATYLKLNSMYRRFITDKKNKPYLQLGFSYGAALALKSNRITNTVFYSSDETINTAVVYMDKKTEFGVVGGFGIPIGKNSAIDARFELSNGMSSFLGNSSSVKTIYLFYCLRL